MPLGSLEDHLHDLPPDKKPLDWNTRMKIAAGAAKGLECLHDKASPPVIYRDLKCSNILLDEGYYPKLSDFGLAKLGPVGDKTHVSTRVMGTYGYCAPEYAMTGQLTLKSVFSGNHNRQEGKLSTIQNQLGSTIWLLGPVPCLKIVGSFPRWLIHCFRIHTQKEDYIKHLLLLQCASRSNQTCVLL